MFRDDGTVDTEGEITYEKGVAAVTHYEHQQANIMAPSGTKEHPARSCKDLFKCYPGLESDYYWIDPNDGSTKDAFRAYCDKELSASCVPASVPITANATWFVGETGHTYFSQMTGGSKFTYEAHASQFTFLRLMYKRTSQKLTFYCKDVVAVAEGEDGSPEKSLRLKTMSGTVLSMEEENPNQYNVIEDGCRFHTGEWSRAVVEYSTKSTVKRLPIVDVAPADIGEESQEFGLELGPVCFL